MPTLKQFIGLTFLSGLVLVTGCVEDKSTSDDSQTIEDAIQENGTNGKMVKYDGEIFSIPSPVQTAILIRKSQAKYNAELLNDLQNASSYVTEVKKAFNLGVYGADLAYLANFGNKQTSIDYFKEVELLSEDLDVKGAIDNTIFTRFYENLDNRDSLYAINAEFYRAGDTYLKDSKRNQVASMIITGGWVEGLYFALDASSVSPDVRKRVAEQGKAIKSLINILSASDDELVIQVTDGLKALSEEYKDIPTNYTYEKPIHDAENKTTYINSKSSVVLSDEKLETIKSKLSAVRTIIIA